MKCRFCGQQLDLQLIDLGSAPLSNGYLLSEDLHKPEKYLPLRVFVCERCWLVQTEDVVDSREIFRSNYAYFSSTSTSWLVHAAQYSDMICSRLQLGPEHLVIEIGANDGYLLKNFVARNIPCIGIEPTDGTADAAQKIGIRVLREFFTASLARRLSLEGKQADLIVGNNVYAHVPDTLDFTVALKTVLKPTGTITLEFPHLMRLLEFTQFDTIYHEHFFYFSLYTVSRIFEKADLRIFDVEELPTHGGSLRIYGCHANDRRKKNINVSRILHEEEARGMQDCKIYRTFQPGVNLIKDNLLAFLIEQKRNGKKIAAYGAAAKGNTLLNYAGIKRDLISYVCDAAASKQNKFLPGSHIPILPPETLRQHRPDIVLILPWNITSEIARQHEYIREWGGQFAVAVPEMRMVNS